MPSSTVASPRRRLDAALLLLLPILLVASPLVAAHGSHSPSCPFSSPAAGSDHDHGEDDGHHHHHHHDDHHGDHHHHHDHHHEEMRRVKLPEELAEDEDLLLDRWGHHDHDHHHQSHHDDHGSELSTIGIWVRAMGCSLLVSLASLICLIILPVIFVQGKPSKGMVDFLALFGAGAMLGDAFLHQLPHAFGGQQSHSHDHHDDHLEHGHSHSLKDLSVGLSILFGIVFFLLVEKVVRYVEDNSGKGVNKFGHGHHHHKSHNKPKSENENNEESDVKHNDGSIRNTLDEFTEKELLNDKRDAYQNDGNHTEHESLLRKRVSPTGANDEKKLNAENSSVIEASSFSDTASPVQSNLVFGYLNLFSDGVHNFTDGMALGSAFLLHGSVGGWSRTLFLLAHELPQEVGDFGILVRSGFTVSKALLFNFLSALVALAGTALALVLGKDPGHSSLIEGFTAGGFIYIAVAGVLPQMNDGKTTLKSTFIQLTALTLGIGVALCISIVE